MQTKQTYQGTCQCGDVRFEADIDISAGTSKCNCTFCWKHRYWGVSVPASAFRAISGQANLSNGERGGFCRRCGIRAYGIYNTDSWGVPGMSGDQVSMSVTCLEGLQVEELLAAPLRFCDGLNDNWMAVPAETRHL